MIVICATVWEIRDAIAAALTILPRDRVNCHGSLAITGQMLHLSVRVHPSRHIGSGDRPTLTVNLGELLQSGNEHQDAQLRGYPHRFHSQASYPPSHGSDRLSQLFPRQHPCQCRRHSAIEDSLNHEMSRSSLVSFPDTLTESNRPLSSMLYLFLFPLRMFGLFNDIEN